MKPDREAMSADLGTQLDRFGEERGGRVACLVVVTSGDIQFCWPGGMGPDAIEAVERALVEALLSELGKRFWDGP